MDTQGYVEVLEMTVANELGGPSLSSSRKKMPGIEFFSLVLIGAFWAIFGTSALISYKYLNLSVGRNLRPFFQVLIPTPGAVVIQADFTWNFLGLVLIILGIFYWKYAREKVDARHRKFRRTAVLVSSILFFVGLLGLNFGLFLYQVFCYTSSAMPTGVVCSNIFTLPNFSLEFVIAVVGSASFALPTLWNLEGITRSGPVPI